MVSLIKRTKLVHNIAFIFCYPVVWKYFSALSPHLLIKNTLVSLSFSNLLVQISDL